MFWYLVAVLILLFLGRKRIAGLIGRLPHKKPPLFCWFAPLRRWPFATQSTKEGGSAWAAGVAASSGGAGDSDHWLTLSEAQGMAVGVNKFLEDYLGFSKPESEYLIWRDRQVERQKRREAEEGGC